VGPFKDFYSSSARSNLFVDLNFFWEYDTRIVNMSMRWYMLYIIEPISIVK
jgi:hypothetical protein